MPVMRGSKLQDLLWGKGNVYNTNTFLFPWCCSVGISLQRRKSENCVFIIPPPPQKKLPGKTSGTAEQN